VREAGAEKKATSLEEVKKKNTIPKAVREHKKNRLTGRGGVK